MNHHEKIVIDGMEEGTRVSSRVLEERIQKAVERGYLDIDVQAYGQHGIGGRLWNTGENPVKVDIYGYPGQRIGSMGSPQTCIEMHAPASDDVGWLNAGATIVVHGDATNGVANAMAQGKVYVEGDIGARGMTMTKSNPRFDPPQLWVLGGVGDSFAEFMAGGVAVVCGIGSHYRGNILGHRPCVGMVGGKIFFRGTLRSFSDADAKLVRISDEDWEWLSVNMVAFLESIGRKDLYDILTSDRSKWQLLVALKPHEKNGRLRVPMDRFRTDVWEKELGQGGLIGDLTDIDRSPVPEITTGNLRRFVPAWENNRYMSPCQAYCPTGIPVQKRWDLVRKGEIDKAIDLAFEYTPFPATVCGYLCPNICMDHCTRGQSFLPAVDISILGRASINARDPKPQPPTGKKVAVIGGGPAGLSVAWQLWINGHESVVYDRSKKLGGKISSVIPHSRIPKEVFELELKRVTQKVSHVQLEEDITDDIFQDIRDAHDVTIIAVGAQTPRMLNAEKHKQTTTALDFLQKAKAGRVKVGKRVVVIGAGNVGCDVATEAHRYGADDITLIDIQEPASFGKEREAAEQIGAKFIWPVFTRAITAKGVELTNGDILPADLVVVSIGDQPDLSFLPVSIHTKNGFIEVDDAFRTSDPKVFAIGDSVRPGLLTDAIGAGRRAARAIDALLRGKEERFDQLPVIDSGSIRLEYYNPRQEQPTDLESCSFQCASCGLCRDCGLCEAICPQQAISRRDLENSEYEYVVDENLCIGCGFCSNACPCGIWELKENDPLEQLLSGKK
jgi:NADPH-dependent glutamate synthase beta subunit-like oxidoreductase/glutamate synthase domain-containing protein 3/NAD-dependent dihydropyrimidine dehydrogenase PreA subunit